MAPTSKSIQRKEICKKTMSGHIGLRCAITPWHNIDGSSDIMIPAQAINVCFPGTGFTGAKISRQTEQCRWFHAQHAKCIKVCFHPWHARQLPSANTKKSCLWPHDWMSNKVRLPDGMAKSIGPAARVV
jgi:hypothetical protein